MGKIRVLVASDYQLVRTALRLLLKTDDAFDVLLTESEISRGLPRAYQTISPDVLLVEVAGKRSTSLRLPVEILARVPNARIVFLSTNEDVSYVRSMLATGVLGYVLKAATPSELFQAIRHVHRGRQFLDWRLSKSIENQLSRRETEVLRAIALGYTTKEIADAMDVSQKTVQTYRERIYTKLELKTRSDLVHYAVAQGLAWEAER